MKNTLVIMAAGMGSRYKGLKQLDGMGPNGEMLIEYALFDALNAGFNKFVFVVRQDFLDKFKELFGSKIDQKAEVFYAIQKSEVVNPHDGQLISREKPWGTGQAILAVQPFVNEPFAVINADDFYGKASYVTALNLMSKSAENQYGMVAYLLKNTLSESGGVTRGVCKISGTNQLESIYEGQKIHRKADGVIYELYNEVDKPIEEETPVSMNFWVFNPSVFKSLERGFTAFLTKNHDQPSAEFLLPTHIGSLIETNEVSVEVANCDAQWFGVTYPEDKALVNEALTQLVAKTVYPETLWR